MLPNESETLSPIQEFFAGSTIFITGATGFMGKCLLEKLLRSCPDINRIYILVREKRGKKAEGRIEELFQDCLFNKLKGQSNKYRGKVVAISGDMSLSGLGLSMHDRSRLQQEVQVVFHAAATVNFNEKMKLAVAININGTKEILNLCADMKNLKSIVHVSTAYSNCFTEVIQEKFYKYPVNYKDLPLLLEKLDNQEAEELTPHLLGNWPNTYTFTKAMAENLVLDSRTSLPISVFRPAIVVSTWKEPLQGWVDNIYGPTGICAGALMGVLGSLPISDNIVANIVPVDYAVNALIAVAWHTAMKREKNHRVDLWENNNNNNNNNNVNKFELIYQTPNLNNEHNQNIYESGPEIFNYVLSKENPVYWEEFCTINMMHGTQNPLKNAVWNVEFKLISNPVLHSMNMIFMHLLPALFADALAILFGKKPRLFKIYKQTVTFINVILYFTERNWQFENDNTKRLWNMVDNRDKEIFPFNMADIDWMNYFRTYITGLRKYLCKEDESTLPEAKKKRTRFIYISTCFKLLLFFVLMNVLYSTLRTICTF